MCSHIDFVTFLRPVLEDFPPLFQVFLRTQIDEMFDGGKIEWKRLENYKLQCTFGELLNYLRKWLEWLMVTQYWSDGMVEEASKENIRWKQIIELNSPLEKCPERRLESIFIPFSHSIPRSHGQINGSKQRLLTLLQTWRNFYSRHGFDGSNIYIFTRENLKMKFFICLLLLDDDKFLRMRNCWAFSAWRFNLFI